MTRKQMEDLADLVAAKIVLELFGDADQRAKAKRDFEDQFLNEERPTDHLASVFADMTDEELLIGCLLYTSPSPRDLSTSRMPSSA